MKVGLSIPIGNNGWLLPAKFLPMDDCRVGPLPQAPVQLSGAGSSDAGMAFSTAYVDYCPARWRQCGAQRG